MKKVILILDVPDSEFCFINDNSHPPCKFLNLEGVAPSCGVSFSGQEDVEKGTRKDPKCAALKEIVEQSGVDEDPKEPYPPCTFCRREGIDPPAMGSKATGSYRDVGSYVDKPKVFNGYVCDMHHDNVVWVSFRWAATPQLITVANCHGGKHNDPTKM